MTGVDARTRELYDRLTRVQERLRLACRRSGGDPAAVTLVAVTKEVGVDDLRRVLGLGVRDIGENRAQEMVRKYEVVGDEARWHFIGHLQTNKVKYVVDKTRLIHSLDRPSLAEELQRRAERRGLVVQALIQVNTSGEESKFGLPPEEVPEFREWLKRCRNIRVRGLMTMAPFFDDPEETRPIFRRTKELFDRLRADDEGFDLLSMGMTNDFEVAVEEGANIVRIGRAIFGERDDPGEVVP